MAKPLSDKKPDHSFKAGGAPNYPLPPYGGYMGDPYGAYGGGPGFNQVNAKYLLVEHHTCYVFFVALLIFVFAAYDLW
jgi:hypothetical protein